MIKISRLIFVILLFISQVCFAGTSFKYPKFKAWDSNGNPLAGGRLYTYAAGTTTAKTVYEDSSCTTPHSAYVGGAYVELDSNGEETIYTCYGSYKFVLKDSNDVTLWTFDNYSENNNDITQYYYSVDTSATDQCTTTAEGNRTLKDFATSIGTSKKATIVFPHTGASNTTDCLCSTTWDASSYTNIKLEFQNGARLKDDVNNASFTWGGQIEAEPDQQIADWGNGSGSFILSKSKIPKLYPNQFGTNTTPGTTDMTTAITQCVAACRSGNIPMEFLGQIYAHTGVTFYPHMKISGKGRYSVLYNTSTGAAHNVTLSKGSNSSVIDLYLRDITLAGVQLSGAGIYSDSSNQLQYSEFDNVLVYLCGKSYAGAYLHSPANCVFKNCQGGPGNSEVNGANGPWPSFITIPAAADLAAYGWHVVAAASSSAYNNTWINCHFEGTERTNGIYLQGHSSRSHLNQNFIGCVFESGAGSALGANASLRADYVDGLTIQGASCEQSETGYDPSNIDVFDINNCSGVSIGGIYSQNGMSFDVVRGLSIKDSHIPNWDFISAVTDFSITGIRKDKSGAEPTGTSDYLTAWPMGDDKFLDGNLIEADTQGNTFATAISDGETRNGWICTEPAGGVITRSQINGQDFIKITGGTAASTDIRTALQAADVTAGAANIRGESLQYYTCSYRYKVNAAVTIKYVTVTCYDSSWVKQNITEFTINNQGSAATYGNNVTLSSGEILGRLTSTTLISDGFTFLAPSTTYYIKVGVLVDTGTEYVEISDITIRKGVAAIMGNNWALKNLSASATWDAGSIADGDEEAKDVTVVGAALGDTVDVSLSIDVADLALTAKVTAADTVTCQLLNNTGGAIDLASATINVYVKRK